LQISRWGPPQKHPDRVRVGLQPLSEHWLWACVRVWACAIEREDRTRQTRETFSTRDAIMRTKALINHFHDLQPIYSAHFEPSAKGRLATAGGDNNVRVFPLPPHVSLPTHVHLLN